MTKEQKMELVRKVGLFGLKDLRKLAPIGDLGYLNAIDYYRGDYLNSGLIKDIMKAFDEQQKKYGWDVVGRSSRYRNTDNTYYCKDLGLKWAIDSGD